jgi:signal transduction histidine kinase
VATAHRDPSKLAIAEEYERRWPTQPDGIRGAARVIRTGVSELYPDIEDSMLTEAAVDEEHLQLLRETDMRSLVSVPLASEGKVFGAMTLISTRPQLRYDVQDLTLIEELGRRAGIAIEHARLYEGAQKAIQKRDDFLSVASHELRTPLTSLQLHLSALLDSAERGRLYDMPPEKIGQRLGKSLEQVHRLTALIDELLDVSRIGGGKLSLLRQHVDLSELVREVSARFEQDARRSGSKIVLRSRPVVGNWDRGRIDQILTNLLSNALKYGAGKPIEISVDKQNGTARLIVRDHGIGIHTRDQARIFERFERTHDARNFGGLGLGLWIVRELAAGHGGRVSVESEIDQGARFIVELPMEEIGGDGVEGRDGRG